MSPTPKYTTSDACKTTRQFILTRPLLIDRISSADFDKRSSVWHPCLPPNACHSESTQQFFLANLKKRLVGPIYRQFSIKHLIPRWRCFDLQEAWKTKATLSDGHVASWFFRLHVLPLVGWILARNGLHFVTWYMGVSKNRGTPKWMVYNGNPYWNGWFGGFPIFGNFHIVR